ncbi:hypothetical protein [Devosia sp.]|nr:hypothetical protein [Devosia sp.]
MLELLVSLRHIMAGEDAAGRISLAGRVALMLFPVLLGTAVAGHSQTGV